MSMYVAMNRQQQLVTVQDVERGLACDCVCVECGEVLVARKGGRNEHHFAHYSNKESCAVHREGLLHLFGKQVIREAMGLQMPHLPDWPPQFGDPSSWWDFEQVEEEVWLDGFRPDLFAHLRGGQQVLIEIAVTSFIGETKLALIKERGLWALEIDLSDLHDSEIAVPSEDLRQLIVHRTEHKYWVYPESARAAVLVEQAAAPVEPIIKTSTPEHRFTINEMWVSARELPSGALAVRSISFSPQVRDLLKALAREMGGYYKPAYKNWVFPVAMAPLVLARLHALASAR